MKYQKSTMVKSLKGFLAGSLLMAAGFSTASAALISITPGNPGNQGTDNVLFNDPNYPLSGSLVQGTFNGAGAGYVINFTSTSGTGLLQASGGQATILGGPGNEPFTNLTFGLSDGATFTKAILNPDVHNDNGNGTIDFTVVYLYGAGSPFMQSFSVQRNGSNFFGIEAAPGVGIREVTFNTTDTAFIDSSQFRLGGFAPAQRVPDGGTTIALLGSSLLGLGAARRMFKAKA